MGRISGELSRQDAESMLDLWLNSETTRYVYRAMAIKQIFEAPYKYGFVLKAHVCWAYMLGSDRLTFRANDDGEPSSTAGKPILGQINSNVLTDILILVIRYFGGIELGTSGLIVAYRTAAAEAIAAAEIEERTVDEDITVRFEYPFLNGIMVMVLPPLTTLCAFISI